MTVLSISAVDHTTSELTITAHGLATGAGAGRLFAGTAGAIPAGLAGVTDYWFIVVDANTVKPASSSANALANIPVTFTGNGTLPLQLLLGIPFTRATTYAANSQVKSADLDALQDFDTVMWNLFTGQAQSTFGDLVLASGQNIDLQGTGYIKTGIRTRVINGGGVAATGTVTSRGGGLGMSSFNANVAVPMNVGERVRAIRAIIADNSLGSTLHMLAGYNTGATSASLGTSAASSGTGATQTLALTGLSQLIASGSCLEVDVQAATGNAECFLYSVEVDYDTP